MVFDSKRLRATSTMKGRRINITQQSLTGIIGCPNEGIECYFSHKEIAYEGYYRERAIRELMNEKSDVLNVAKLDASNRLLIHGISQTIIPRVSKSNRSTFLEIVLCLVYSPWVTLESLLHHAESHEVYRDK